MCKIMLCFLLVAFHSMCQAADLGAGTVWPQPSSMKQTDETYFLTTNTKFFSQMPKCFLLQDALSRTKRNVLSSSLLSVTYSTIQQQPGDTNLYYRGQSSVETHMHTFDGGFNLSPKFLSTVQVVLSQVCDETRVFERPSYAMDESYSLRFEDSVATITAEQVWGALHGLETFSQLVHRFPDGSWRVNSSSIIDYPVFKHRGTLLDTSRHFLPKEFILKHLEAMSYNKMNIFHWHIVDDPSFPYESYTFPNLSSKGSYQIDSFHVYSQQDVADVIEFARRRGIRVIPEFDTPGHTLSWGPGMPNLLTPCYAAGKPSGTFGPIDPSRNSSFVFLSKLFQEIMHVFPDSFLHLGGDEVSFDCWKSNPNISKFMVTMGFGSDYAKLEEYYEQTFIDLLSSLSVSKKHFVVWQEIVDNGVRIPASTLIHVWKKPHPSEMEKITAKGFQVLLSSCWYLDWIQLQDWDIYYKCDPLNFNGTAAQKKLVVGGEACLWGEYVDSSVSISRFWPRGSAVAERLWSNKSDWTPANARPRLEAQRCRMLYRGLQVEPALGPSYCSFGQPFNRF